MQLPPNCTTKLIDQFNPPAVIKRGQRSAERQEAKNNCWRRSVRLTTVRSWSGTIWTSI